MVNLGVGGSVSGSTKSTSRQAQLGASGGTMAATGKSSAQ